MRTNIFPKIEITSALHDTNTQCPTCGSRLIIKKGKMRRQCRVCGRTFKAPEYPRKNQYFGRKPRKKVD